MKSPFLFRKNIRTVLSALGFALIAVGFHNCSPAGKFNVNAPSIQNKNPLGLANPAPAPAPSPAPVVTPAPAPIPAPVTPATPIPLINSATVVNLSVSHGQSVRITTDISAGAGFTQALVESYKRWRSVEAGAFLEYTVNSPVKGKFGIAVAYTTSVQSTPIEFILNGTSLGIKTLQATNQLPEGQDRIAVFVELNEGINKFKIVSNSQGANFDINEVQFNFPNHPVANFGMVQALSLSAPKVLMADAVSDFYRLFLNGSTWECAWSYCFVEFLVSSAQEANYQISVAYSQQVPANHACAGFSVNGVTQDTVEMLSPDGQGVTTPKTIKVPAGVSKLRIYNSNFFNGVFCYGAFYRSITVSP